MERLLLRAKPARLHPAARASCPLRYHRSPCKVLMRVSGAGVLMVLPVRIELTASPLPRECSTTELRQHYCAGAALGAARQRGLLCHSASLDARPKNAYQRPRRLDWPRTLWANPNRRHCVSKDWPQSFERTSSAARLRRGRALPSPGLRPPERTRTRNRKPFSGPIIAVTFFLSAAGLAYVATKTSLPSPTGRKAL